MSAEEMLSRTVRQLPPPAAGVCSGDAYRVKDVAAQLEEVAEALRNSARDLGIEGLVDPTLLDLVRGDAPGELDVAVPPLVAGDDAWGVVRQERPVPRHCLA